MHFKALDGLSGKVIAQMIKDEHPQVLALVLSQLPSNIAAACLKELAEPNRTTIIQKMTQTQSVNEEALRKLDEHLLELRNKYEFVTPFKRGGLAQAASILAKMSDTDQQAMLHGLSEKDQELARSIKDRLFTFDDIIKIPVQQMPLLHRQVGRLWEQALRGASDPVRDHVFNSLSKGAAEDLKELLDLGKPLNKKNVEQARRQIIEKINALKNEGVIQLSDPNDPFI